MALVSMRQLLDHAAEHGYGVPAFNVNNLEQMRAILEGASETDSPVIVQASAGARKYAGANFLRHLGEAKIMAKLPFVRELAKTYIGVDPVHEPIPIRSWSKTSWSWKGRTGAPSTETPQAWAISTTRRVTATL